MRHDYLIRCETHGDLALVAAEDATLALCKRCEATCSIVDCGNSDRANYPVVERIACELCGNESPEDELSDKVDGLEYNGPVHAECARAVGRSRITVHVRGLALWADDGGNAYRLTAFKDRKGNRSDLVTAPISASTNLPLWDEDGEPAWGQIDYADEAVCIKAYEVLSDAAQRFGV